MLQMYYARCLECRFDSCANITCLKCTRSHHTRAQIALFVEKIRHDNWTSSKGFNLQDQLDAKHITERRRMSETTECQVDVTTLLFCYIPQDL